MQITGICYKMNNKIGTVLYSTLVYISSTQINWVRGPLIYHCPDLNCSVTVLFIWKPSRLVQIHHYQNILILEILLLLLSVH